MKKRSWGSIRKRVALLATATAMAMTSVVTVAPAITAHAEEEECDEHSVADGAAKWPGTGEWKAETGGALSVFVCNKCNKHVYYDGQFFELTPAAKTEVPDDRKPQPGHGLLIGKQQKAEKVLEITAQTGGKINITKDGDEKDFTLSGKEGWSDIAADIYTRYMPYTEIVFSDVMHDGEVYSGELKATFGDDGKTILMDAIMTPGVYTAVVTVAFNPEFFFMNPAIQPFSFPVKITVEGEEIGRNLILEKDRSVTVGADVSISLKAITTKVNNPKASVYYFVSENDGEWKLFDDDHFTLEGFAEKKQNDTEYFEINRTIKVPTGKAGIYKYGAVVYVKGPDAPINRPELTDKSAVYYTDESLMDFIYNHAEKDTLFKDVVIEDKESNYYGVEKHQLGKNVIIKVGAPVTYSPRTTAAPQPAPAPAPQPQPEEVPEVLGVTRVQTPQTGLADKPMFYIVMMGVSAAVAVTGIVIKSRSRTQRRRK